MNEEKRKGEFLVGVVKGREIISTNDNPTPEEGEWKKSYRYAIMVNPTDNFLKKITVFDNCKGFEMLVEGNTVSVGYNNSPPTYNEKAKKNIIYKTAFWVGEPRSADLLQKAAQAPEQQKITTTGKDSLTALADGDYSERFLAYAEKYMAKAKDDKDLRYATRMVGGFLNNVEPFRTKMKPLFEKCNAMLGIK